MQSTIRKDGNERSAKQLRRVKGGLDHAVLQADERGLQEMFVVDSDCHQMEPFALFSKYLPDPWRKIITDKELSSDTDTDPLAVATFDKNNRPPQYLHGRIRRTEVSYPKPQKPEELVDLFTNRMYRPRRDPPRIPGTDPRLRGEAECPACQRCRHRRDPPVRRCHHN